MSPVVAVNAPERRRIGGEHQTGIKPGIGRPSAARRRREDRRSARPATARSSDREGLLLVNGPNLMLGYLGPAGAHGARSCATAGTSPATSPLIDEDGFIRITDRLSRFSKIGGEMVPHMKIEEAINAILGDTLRRDRRARRVARRAARRVLHARRRHARRALGAPWRDGSAASCGCRSASASSRSTRFPTLGTGKVDLRRIRELARERINEAVEQ